MIESPYKFIQKNSKNIIIIFQSGSDYFYQPDRIKIFESEKNFKKINIDSDLLFIKDIGIIKYNYSYYLDEIENLKIFLENIISKYNKTIFTGFSVGGYASMLYGSLLGVDSVLSFAGPTRLLDFDTNKFLNEEEYFKKRNIKNFEHIKKYFNLKNLINKKTIYYLNCRFYNKNGEEFLLSIEDFLNRNDILEYKNLNNMQKLHCHLHYNNVSNFENVFWLPFKNSSFTKNNDFQNYMNKKFPYLKINFKKLFL